MGCCPPPVARSPAPPEAVASGGVLGRREESRGEQCGLCNLDGTFREPAGCGRRLVLWSPRCSTARWATVGACPSPLRQLAMYTSPLVAHAGSRLWGAVAASILPLATYVYRP